MHMNGNHQYKKCMITQIIALKFAACITQHGLACSVDIAINQQVFKALMVWRLRYCFFMQLKKFFKQLL